MKKVVFHIVITMVFMSGTMFTNCQPSTQKTEDAKAKVQEAKSDLNDAQQAANAEEWKAFKEESNVRIQKNEMRIAELKAKMKTTGKKLDAFYVKTIDDLEQKNKEMKIKMDSYSNNAQSDWASFKREFNHDMDGLGQALEDLTVDNKK